MSLTVVLPASSADVTHRRRVSATHESDGTPGSSTESVCTLSADSHTLSSAAAAALGLLPLTTTTSTLQQPHSANYILIIIVNEYYYSAMESKKTSRALNNRKNKTNDSVTTQDKNRSQTVGDQNERLKSSVFSRRLKAMSDGPVYTGSLSFAETKVSNYSRRRKFALSPIYSSHIHGGHNLGGKTQEHFKNWSTTFSVPTLVMFYVYGIIKSLIALT